MKKPRVTELISLLDKPALLKWANSQGLKGVDISKKEWLKDGTSIHEQIENYILNKIPFKNIEDQKRCDIFLSDKKVLEIEKSIETDYYIGRYDAKILYKDKEYIIDFKNNLKGIYLEHKLQLISYALAENCSNIALVSVPKFELFEITIEDWTPYFEIMKSLSNIYYCKNLINN